MSAHRGFTLVELIVVIGIIGLLASVILVSLENARGRARDTAIKSEVYKLRTIMHQEGSDTGGFAAIKQGGQWKFAGTQCGFGAANPFSGNYAVEADAACDAIMAKLPAGTPCSNRCLFFLWTDPDADDKYSIITYLPGASRETGVATYLCYGSSGRTSIGPAGDWTSPGCYANP